MRFVGAFTYGGVVDGEADEKRMRLRYAGTCRICGLHLPARAEAVYERTTKTVRCVSHNGSASIEPAAERTGTPGLEDVVASGTAGASARREFERRKAKQEERIRTRHLKLGGLILALSDEQPSTTAWAIGAAGEQRLGQGLGSLVSDGVRLLHDRRIPNSRANIDHVAVTANGVYVIDAKTYRGRPRLKVEGGLFGPRVERLLIGPRDCTRLVDGVLKQVEVVRGLLDTGVPVHGVLCFIDADWPLIGGAFRTRGVQAPWPNKLYPQLQREGSLTDEIVADAHRTLAHALPAA